MKNKLNIFAILALLLFLFNSCELLNPLIGSKTNKTTPIPPSQNFVISIERTHGTILGQSQAVEITLQNNTKEDYKLGGFDLRFSYDASALTFQTADPGQFLVDCGWEYFTYRNRGTTNDSSGFGIISIFALAETNNGPGNHPDCFNTEESISNKLAVLNFLVTNDRAFECEFAPIQFLWDRCRDNTISGIFNKNIYLSKNIYNFIDSRTIDYSNNIAADFQLPSYYGASSICDSQIIDRYQQDPLRNIDLVNGGIDIGGACFVQNARGDINLNEIAYEIADAVLYSNYFVYGESVFTGLLDSHIVASDVNADSLTLTVADLVYLIRVLVGDALPYPREASNDATYVNGTIRQYQNGIVDVTDDLRISAVHLVVSGDITPTLLAENMNMNYNFDSTNTNILIYSLTNNNFTGEFINIGDNEIISFEMADYLGNQVIPTFVPTTYELGQNYPNPFNPTTTIPFSIPFDADVTLDIYNSNGQKVASFSGTFKTGEHSFVWDATNFPSGLYSYTFRANNFVATKTMMKVG